MGGRKNEKLEEERGSGGGKIGRSRGRRTEKKAEREETKRVREGREREKVRARKRVIFTSVKYMVSACIGKQTRKYVENGK